MAKIALVYVALSLQITIGDALCLNQTCDNGQVCCGYDGCIFASNCLFQACLNKFDCSSGQSCCSRECRDSPDCVGYSCDFAYNCDRLEICCNGTCSKAECTTDTPPIISDQSGDGQVLFVIWLVITIVTNLGVVICLMYCCFNNMCSLGKCAHRRVTAGPRVTFTTTPTGNTTENNQHHPGHAPPPYQESQESYSSVLPPQYEEQQTTLPPPYSPDGRTTPPPPYTEAPQDRSGGVYTPQPSMWL